MKSSLEDFNMDMGLEKLSSKLRKNTLDTHSNCKKEDGLHLHRASVLRPIKGANLLISLQFENEQAAKKWQAGHVK
ncbi:hypothetical protein GJ496_009358 [Pomphorhynchus laevis]|nr:hypothetical protein GJ496_009358 [Pomphorhynchus laevis]